MQMFIDGEGAEPLFDAIKAAPFSPEFAQSFIDEILTAPWLRFGGPGFEGFFDCRDMAALGGEASDLLVRVRLGRAGKLMISALRALTSSPEEERGHATSPVEATACESGAEGAV